VEGFRNIDGGSDGHDMIMARMTGLGLEVDGERFAVSHAQVCNG